MSTAVATTHAADISAMEQVVIQGDLSKLTPQDRVLYYREVCQSTGLNPVTRPFDYIVLNGKLTLYAKRDATDQLRKIHGVSITRLERERTDDLCIVTAYAKDADGREDSSTGAVSIASLKGEALANAIMKSETKAKRRVTLSICGLGLLDETEVSSVADARPAHIDTETGEIIEPGRQLRERAADEPAYAAMTVADASKDGWRWFAAKADKLGHVDHAAVCKALGVSALKTDLPDATLGSLLDRLSGGGEPPADLPYDADAERAAIADELAQQGMVMEPARA